jgi:hypothetical protein
MMRLPALCLQMCYERWKATDGQIRPARSHEARILPHDFIISAAITYVAWC